MKKIIVLFMMIGMTFVGFCHGHHGCFRPVRHCHGGYYHRDGGFLPAFVGGIVGGAIANVVTDTVRNDRVVVQQPVYVQQQTVVQEPVYVQRDTVVQKQMVPVQVWVPGHYEDRTDAYGYIQKVWIPGYYKTVYQYL